MVILFSAPALGVESQTHLSAFSVTLTCYPSCFTGNAPYSIIYKLSIICSLFLSEDKDRDLFAAGWQSRAFQSPAAPGQRHSDDPGAGCDMCVW